MTESAHALELEWLAASETDSYDGSLTFWLDGDIVGELTVWQAAW